MLRWEMGVGFLGLTRSDHTFVDCSIENITFVVVFNRVILRSPRFDFTP